MNERKNFYIQYTPEITPDIFKQLGEKLSTYFGPQFIDSSNWKDYEHFKQHGYINCSEKVYSRNGWCIDNNTQRIALEKHYSEVLKEKTSKLPKTGEFWVYVRGKDISTLSSSDDIYEIFSEEKMASIKRRWTNNKICDVDIKYEFSNMSAWRKATDQDLITAGLLNKPFVLPEKWCIKDYKEVGPFFESYNYGNYSCDGNAYLHYPYFYKSSAVHGRACYSEKIEPGYTEITIDQFREHVLKQSVETPVKKEFPSKWCIKVTKDSKDTPEISEWRGAGWCGGDTPYLSYDKYWYPLKPVDYPEITIEQFREHILKQPKKMDAPKKEFPKEWIIQWKTKGIFDAVCEHFDYRWSWVPNAWTTHDNNYHSSKETNPTSLPEITFEEFKEHVLKKPVNSVKTKSQNTCVQCKTQEEWDFVSKTLKYEWTGATWGKYGDKSCIVTNNKSYCYKEFFEREGYKIHSFEEWCKANNLKFESMAYDSLSESGIDFIPKIGDYITIIGRQGLLGKTGIIRYNTEYEGGSKDPTRCSGPSISDFNSTKTGNFSYNNTTGFCFKASDRTYRKSTLEEIQWLDRCIKQNSFVPKDYFYKKGPRFNIGDELKICKRGEDKNQWGYLLAGGKGFEKIYGVAEKIIKVKNIQEYEGRYYYESKQFMGTICEDCLTPINSTNTQSVFPIEQIKERIGKIEILQEEKILNVFKPKKSSKMSYYAEKTQVPRTLTKTIKQSIF